MSISVRDLTVTAPSTQAILCGLTLELRPGEITLLVGPTGSGKSTLLQALSGLIPLNAGSVTYAERNLWHGAKIDHDLQKRIALVFQSPERQLFARTVQNEFDYSLRPYKLSREEKQARISASLSALQLPTSMLPQSPLTLSGGLKRRLAIATTLATQPEWLFLDEPTAGLDPSSALNLRQSLVRRSASATGGIVIATHDLDTFFTVADQVVVLSGGNIIAQGTPTELIHKHQILLDQTIGLPTAIATAKALATAGLAVSPSPGSARALAEQIAQSISQSVDEEQRSLTDAMESGAMESLNPQRQIPPKANLQRGNSRQNTPVLSLFQKLDVRVKWASYILLSIGYVLQNHLLGLIGITLITGGITILSGVRVRQLLGLIRPFVAFIAISVVFSGLQFHFVHGWFHHLGYAPVASFRTFESLYKILLITILGIILAETSSQLQMKMGLERSLSGLKKFRIPVEAIALGTSLLLRFIPLIAGEAERFSAIARSRGKSSARPGQIRLQDMRAVVIPLLIGVFQLGEDLSFAMELRGYERIGKTRTSSFQIRMTRLDWIAVVIGFLLFASLLTMTVI